MVLPRSGGHHSNMWNTRSAPTLGPSTAGRNELQHSTRFAPLSFGPHGALTHYSVPTLDKYRPVGQQGSTFGPGNGRRSKDRFAEYSKRNFQTLTTEAYKVSPLPDVEVFKGHQGYRRTPGFRIVAPSSLSRMPRPVSDSEVPAGNYPPSDGYPPMRRSRSANSLTSSTSTRSFGGSLGGSQVQSRASTPSRTRSSPSRGYRAGSPAYSVTSSVLSRAGTAERELDPLHEDKPAEAPQEGVALKDGTDETAIKPPPPLQTSPDDDKATV